MANAPYLLHGEMFEVLCDHPAGDGCEPVRLLILGGDLGQHLGEAQTHGNGNA